MMLLYVRLWPGQSQPQVCTNAGLRLWVLPCASLQVFGTVISVIQSCVACVQAVIS